MERGQGSSGGRSTPKLKDFDGYQSSNGRKPFEDFTINGSQKKLSSIRKAYNPPCSDSKTYP